MARFFGRMGPTLLALVAPLPSIFLPANIEITYFWVGAKVVSQFNMCMVYIWVGVYNILFEWNGDFINATTERIYRQPSGRWLPAGLARFFSTTTRRHEQSFSEQQSALPLKIWNQYSIVTHRLLLQSWDLWLQYTRSW